MNTKNIQEYLSFAKDIARKAEKIMLKYYTGDNGSFYKFDNTIVTKADTEINHYLIEQARKRKKAGHSDRYAFVGVCRLTRSSLCNR